MKALPNKHATHPWTDETGYHGLHLEVDDSKVLDALVRHLEALGWSAWIVGFLETPERRPAAYLFRKV